MLGVGFRRGRLEAEQLRAYRRRADGAERVSRATVCTSVTGSFAPLRARARHAVRGRVRGACEARARHARAASPRRPARESSAGDGPRRCPPTRAPAGAIARAPRATAACPPGQSRAGPRRPGRASRPLCHAAPPSCSLEPGPMLWVRGRATRSQPLRYLVIETPTGTPTFWLATVRPNRRFST